MPKISIIMPVYNGSQWLDESITSVINQTFDDFELICVNDSSTDNSEEILKEFSNKDSRIKYFTKENEGPGMALNFGIEKAQGEYLCFIDQDDKYAENYLEKMYKAIKKTSCDICECNAYLWESENIKRAPYPYVKSKKNIVNISSAKKKIKFSEHYFPQWTKIIKKDFLIKNNIEFPSRENKAHDIPVHYKLIALCDKIGYLDECIYYHRIHPNQISYNFDTALYYLMSVKDVLNWLKNYNVFYTKKVKQFLKYLIVYAILAVKDVEICDELSQIICKNYIFLDRYKMNRLLKKKIKILKQNKKMNILELPKIQNAIVGKNSYCASQPFIASPKTSIGNFVSIGENVRIGHGEHPLNFLSSSPYFYFDNLGWKTNKTPSHNEFWNYEPVNIGNDVWIGDNVLIKNGIKIGDGAVIGMGSIVTKDVPPYAVVVGTPAKIIKYRFNEETIKKLLELKWWNFDDEELKKLNYDNLNEAIKELENLKSLHS